MEVSTLYGWIFDTTKSVPGLSIPVFIPVSPTVLRVKFTIFEHRFDPMFDAQRELEHDVAHWMRHVPDVHPTYGCVSMRRFSKVIRDQRILESLTTNVFITFGSDTDLCKFFDEIITQTRNSNSKTPPG